MTRILIVDDHPVVAEGWERIAKQCVPCEVHCADSLLGGFQRYRAVGPDVLILDLAFGDNRMGGLRLLRRLRARDRRLAILVFSMHQSALVAREALHAGANGYINKDAALDQIRDAFEAILDGGDYVSPELAKRLALLERPGGLSAEATLTPRELEILGLVAQGKSYRQISSEICLSYKTVTNNCYSLRNKLNASTLPDLVLKAIQFFEARAAPR